MQCRGALIVSGLLVLSTPARAQHIPFSHPGWTLSGEGSRIVQIDGGPALHLRTGVARNSEVRLQDGTIEFEVRVTPYRTFVYLHFRIQDDGEYEEFYFRPHKSGLSDALQYTPVYKGVSNWQLYHGRGFTADPRLPPAEWLPVRVVLRGSQAAVFVGNASEPAMVVHHLAREPAPGYIGLRSFWADPQGPTDAAGALFRNVIVRPDDVRYRFPPPVAQPAPAGSINEWHVGQPFAPDSGTIERIPAQVATASGWQTLRTDERGLLVLFKHLPRLQGARRWATLTRVVIHADRARSAPFNVGYSDEVSVFLNGQLLFAADDSYSFDEPRREGLIGLDQATLYLPLRQGPNELVLAVSDVFGGWGVMGQLPDRGGIRVEAR